METGKGSGSIEKSPPKSVGPKGRLFYSVKYTTEKNNKSTKPNYLAGKRVPQARYGRKTSVEYRNVGLGRCIIAALMDTSYPKRV